MAPVNERYPRRSGVLIARELIPICRASASLWKVERRVVPSSTPESRRYLGRLVVKAVRRRFRDLPAELRTLLLPAPDVALARLVMGARTRATLERARGWSPAGPAWTVGRYVEIPGFGIHCLVDLLAAREEAEAEQDAASAGDAGALGALPLPLDPSRLDELSEFLKRRLPSPMPELGRAMVVEGLATRPPSSDELARCYRVSGQPAPFRLVRAQGAEIVAHGPALGVATAIINTASAFIAWWGLGNVESVTGRVGAVKASSPNTIVARRILGGLPKLAWLDDRREWFSFRGDSNRLTVLIRKVLGTVDRVARGELASMLFKGSAAAFQPPAAVIERYLAEVIGCRIEGEFVSLG
jgi:hypothetical protein